MLIGDAAPVRFVPVMVAAVVVTVSEGTPGPMMEYEAAAPV